MPEGINPVALIVAVIGAGGLGAFVRDLLDGILKLRSGVSAKENKRRIDIVQQRDEALQRATDCEKQVDVETSNRRRTQEYASTLRRLLIELGHESSIPPWPIGLDRT